MTLAEVRLTTFWSGGQLSAHADVPAATSNATAMAMPLPKVRYTVDDLDAMPDDGNRYEIIDGELFVTPAPRIAHQVALTALVLRLGPYAKALGLVVLCAPTDVQSSHVTRVEPDLLVVPKDAASAPDAKWLPMRRLWLAAEILSPSTAHVDLGRKGDLYLAENVAQYWVVDVDARTISVFAPGSPDPLVLRDQLKWAPVADRAPLVMDLTEYFDDVSP
jgi:Uma2 family endonuclease